MSIILDSEDEIFEILGMSQLESSEKHKLRVAIRQAAWEDFVNREARDMLSDAEHKALLEKMIFVVVSDGKYMQNGELPEFAYEFPKIREIIREKTAVLIKNLVKTRIDDYGLHGDTRGLLRMFEAGDWDGISKRLGAIRFVGDLNDLIDRAVSKSAPCAEAMPDRLDDAAADSGEPDISAPLWRREDSSSGKPGTLDEVDDAASGFHIFEAIHSEIAALNIFREEEVFALRIGVELSFSYRIDTPENLMNRAIAETLRGIAAKRRQNFFETCTFKRIDDFRTMRERDGDREFDFDSLSNKHNVLCVENFDLISSLNDAEFRHFIVFLRKNRNRMFLFFGDFSSPAPGFVNRYAEIEEAINIRLLDAQKMKIDEMSILVKVFESNGWQVPEDIRETLARAWQSWRDAHRESEIRDVMRAFAEKTALASLSKHEERVVSGDSFDWIGHSAHMRAIHGVPGAVEPLRRFDGMIGMENVKRQIETITANVCLSRVQAEAGMPVEPINLSFVFTGNPGTGKTTTARLLASTLNEFKVLKKGHLVEARRNTLIARYHGQTPGQVTRIFLGALDGVLFIDEAYALCNGSDNGPDDYGKEAIDTLTHLMSDFAGRICVILAGYERDMEEMMERVNPGLRDRFVYHVRFGDYGEDELWEIFRQKTAKRELMLAPGAEDLLREKISRVSKARDERFANGRAMDNLFQKMTDIQAMRLARRIYSSREISPDDLRLVTVGDCEALLSEDSGEISRAGRRIGFAG
ncbi:MAG: AAA family ATPase [Synergistaceae bacterium]|jgi:Cdc6-like AAA superfamily ATPase|nr:AAA family ATPase [Synergistaceae bacterium]